MWMLSRHLRVTVAILIVIEMFHTVSQDQEFMLFQILKLQCDGSFGPMQPSIDSGRFRSWGWRFIPSHFHQLLWTFSALGFILRLMVQQYWALTDQNPGKTHAL